MIPSYQHRSSHLRAPRPEAPADSTAADKVRANVIPPTVLDPSLSRYDAARARGQERGRKNRGIAK